MGAGAWLLARTGGEAPAFTGALTLSHGVVVEEVAPIASARLVVARVPRGLGLRLEARLLAAPGTLGSLSRAAARGGALVAIDGDYHCLDGPRLNLPQAWLASRGELLTGDPGPGYQGSLWLDRAGAPHVGALAREQLGEAWMAIGSGPVLLRGGDLAPGLGEVELPGYVRRLARAAVGIAPNEVILAATIQTPRGGLSHVGMAEALRALGCTEALALDGGPSAALWARTGWRAGRLVNVPPDLGGGEPELASGLLVLPPSSGEPGLR